MSIDAPFSKNSFSYEDLLLCGHGELFGPGNARLPLPPLLMFDRIISINNDGEILLPPISNDPDEITRKI